MSDKWNVASNTPDVFRAAIGETVRGILFECFPRGDRTLSRGVRTIVFASGWGISFSPTGSFWTESPEAIAKAIRREQKKLAQNQAELEGVLSLAGATR